MSFVAVRNLDRYQHYRDRRPLWVKLYQEMRRDPKLVALPPASRLVACLVLLVASDWENRMPDDPAWLAAECAITKREAVQALADLKAISYLVPASEAASEPASTAASNGASNSASASRAPAPSRRERERETPYPFSPSASKTASKPTLLCPVEHCQLRFKTQQRLDEHLANVHGQDQA